VHWGADISIDYNKLKLLVDHSDDIGHEQI
jgi:hypothetical protein